jgi:hypothetical protein
VEIAGGGHWQQESVDVVCFLENEAARCETQPPRRRGRHASQWQRHLPAFHMLAPCRSPCSKWKARSKGGERRARTIECRAAWRQCNCNRHCPSCRDWPARCPLLLDPCMALPDEWTCVRADGWFCTVAGVAVLLLVALTTPQQSSTLPSGPTSEVGSPRAMELRGGFSKGFPQDVSPRKLFPKETYGEGELELGNSFEQVRSHITS